MKLKIKLKSQRKMSATSTSTSNLQWLMLMRRLSVSYITYSLVVSALFLPVVLSHEESETAPTVRQRQLHPGAIAYGRASCGAEYAVPEEPYVLVNPAESFYIRRVQTLEHPL